ncbi:MAG TPA: biotin/lipoyl-binding protein, partial [Usitatibacter sp.]|nr:biotin/lipoyl-binding protein [Usitatibacter sp.]
MAAAAAPNQPPQPTPSAPAPTRRERRPRKQLKWIAAAVVLLAAGFFGVRYWLEESRFVSTDDAYVNANQVQVTAQVSGAVVAVHVRDQEAVRAGDALFEIDPTPY